jgi:hypothetical protein
MKIFLKKGNKNYKERRLLEELEPIIKKRMESEVDFARKFVPATNYEELKAMHDKFVPQDVDYVEINSYTYNMTASKIENDDDKDYDYSRETGFEDRDFIDPFNRENPKVREYVLSEDPLEEHATTHEKPNPFQKFDEPTSFDEAFEIPESAKMGEKKKVKGDIDEEKSTERGSKSGSRESLNPSFDEMSANKKKRSSKKFAKYIVETVCMLTEKGFVWYANKDINEAKLAEYELNGEIDLNLLLTLEDGQEATVKQFFLSQCIAAEQLLKITDDEKSDLTDALAEVMLEKGFAPTPTQELMLVTATIFGKQTITMLALKTQTNNLLAQLRVMNTSPRAANNNFNVPDSVQAQTPKEEIENDAIREEIEKEMLQENEVVTDYFSKSPTELALSESIETVE